MLSIYQLSKYFFASIRFTEGVTLGNYTFRKGEEIEVTPSVLSLYNGQRLTSKSFKLILRELRQLENSEAVELSLIVAPRANFPDDIRTVTRQQSKEGYTIEVHIAHSLVEHYSVVIDHKYNIALSHIITPPNDGKPIITHLAAMNQVAAFDWFLKKQLDVFQLIPAKAAIGRSVWGLSDYDKPNKTN